MRDCVHVYACNLNRFQHKKVLSILPSSTTRWRKGTKSIIPHTYRAICFMPQFAYNGQRMHGMQPSSELEFLGPVPERRARPHVPTHRGQWLMADLDWIRRDPKRWRRSWSLSLIVLSWFFHQVHFTSCEIVIHHPASRPICAISARTPSELRATAASPTTASYTFQ